MIFADSGRPEHTCNDALNNCITIFNNCIYGHCGCAARVHQRVWRVRCALYYVYVYIVYSDVFFLFSSRDLRTQVLEIC